MNLLGAVKMKNKRKRLTWGMPIGIALILFLALWINQINGERQLPSDGWSRTVHPQITTGFEEPYVFKDDKGIHLLTESKSGLTQTVLNEELKATDKSSIKTVGNVQRVIWSDGSSLIYKTNGNLIFQKDGQTKTIAKGVGDAKVTLKGVLYYAQDTKLHTYSLASGATELVQTFNDPIQTLAVDKGQAIICTQDSVQNFHYYVLSTSHPFEAAHEFAVFKGMSHGNISEMEAIHHDGKLGIYFTAHVLRQGEHFYDYYLEFPLDKLDSGKPVDINSSFITFTVKDTGEYLRTPMYTHLYLKDGKPVLIFSSEGARTLRESSINIYEGYQNEKGQWIAERRSTSQEMSQLPFMVDDHTIGWLDYITDGHYQVAFTSQNKAVIDQSMKLKTGDFSHSFSNAALSLSRVFMLFLLMIAYAIPVILIYAIITFTKVELIEQDSQIVKWLLIVVYLVFQYFLVDHIETPSFHFYAPSYLNFEFSQWIIPTLMAVISLIIVKWVKTKDWGIVAEAFYAMIVFSIMELFAFGPYFF
jgi:hypothetical protein